MSPTQTLSVALVATGALLVWLAGALGRTALRHGHPTTRHTATLALAGGVLATAGGTIAATD